MASNAASQVCGLRLVDGGGLIHILITIIIINFIRVNYLFLSQDYYLAAAG
jgi:hypothetical protein